jgi:hypothetical protein
MLSIKIVANAKLSTGYVLLSIGKLQEPKWHLTSAVTRILVSRGQKAVRGQDLHEKHIFK